MYSMQTLNPSDLPQPAGPYSQAVLVHGAGEWLHVSGQVGIDAQGIAPAGIEAQAELAWGNLLRALRGAGMGMEHLVKTTTYLVNRADNAAMRPIRSRCLGQHRPASTLVLVAGLLDEAWLIEVEAVAFRPAD
ncbi:RidA family protein [Xylophilus sp. GOD-11R]|uniref:RidA family protein n=1 Tax=Xylophilus sp. GOD-11R TaxID=3089814 RepID=UPI00298CD98F|nr:RidA family protein [Xylophilus sp. GOD-11R]WPB57624.1 RidA family protein [Xylophilus sp. GOD-11R]